MQVFGTAETMRLVMETESTGKKIGFALQAVVWLAFFAITGSIYMAWLAYANNITSQACDGSILSQSICSFLPSGTTYYD